MVGSIRGTPEGFSHGQASGSQQPPPPPPNWVEVMALQTELIRQLVQGQQNQPRSQQRGRDDYIPQAAGYQEFFGTQPPLFHKTDEPLDADAWLRTIESKFVLLPVPCSKQIRPSSPLSSYVAPPASSGIIIVPCCPSTMSSHGKNSGPPSGRITFLRDSWSRS